MSARRRCLVLAGFALWVVTALAFGAPALIADAAPAVALLGLFALGRYPGERVLVAAARRAAAARRGAQLRAPLGPATLFLPRGGALLGAAMAGRAPPGPCWIPPA